MTLRNGFTEPEIDSSEWVAAPKPPNVPKRWCPTHRRWEVNPEERLMCGAAWAELYKMEREAEMEKLGSNMALVQLADNINNLVEELRYGNVIAEPPAPPQKPRPAPPIPPPTGYRAVSAGKGGVALP